MGRVRRGKKDGNHDALKAVFLQLGCSVADLYNAGLPGFPDIVVGVAGKNALVEIKNPETAYGRAGLNNNQTAFERDWRGAKPFVVSDELEVVALVNSLRRA